MTSKATSSPRTEKKSRMIKSAEKLISSKSRLTGNREKNRITCLISSISASKTWTVFSKTYSMT
jgi:hypothetical protein